jgi:pimeloyl-ACP methyl ester carboxylesterase
MKRKRLSRKRKGLIAALAVTSFLLLNHVASLVAAPLIFNRIFAGEKYDVSLTPGLVDYQSVAASYPRQTFTFPSSDVSLQGYFYDNPSSKRLVVVSAGIDDPADGYLSQEIYFYDQGYDVISYDGYGKGASGGSSLKGLPQAKRDLASLLTYLESSAWVNEPVFLFGHSQGAYASAAILGEGFASVKALVAVSGFDSSEETVMAFARRKVSFLADLSWPYVTTYERYLFGEDSPLKASDQLNNSAIPALIAQGDADHTIPLESLSLYRHKDSCTDPNAQFRLFSGEQGGHSSILYSLGALAYQKEVATQYAELEKANPRGVNEETRRAFCDTIDDIRYSEVNPELMNGARDLFNRF